jgi:16S rRNA (uracil1498-N3)-methyltransferase
MHHLTKALRKKSGVELQMIDGAGCRARGIWQGDAQVKVTAREKIAAPQSHLIFGLGSRESNDESIRRAAEMGLATIQPVLTARSRDAGAPKTAPPDRWLKIMQSACGQSGNPWLPRLHDVADWGDVRSAVADDVAVFAPGGKPLPATAAPFASHMAIGPEGGWTDGEIAGFDTYTLGAFVLRTHVAVAAAAAYVMQRSQHALS